MDLVDKIMEYEDGGMSKEDTIRFFQDLIDTGMAWTLQGHYGRTANALILAGHCKRKSRGEEAEREQQRKLGRDEVSA